MSDPATVTCAKHWYLPIANEAGCVSLFALTNGTFALTLESSVQNESGVIVSAELAQLIKDELIETTTVATEVTTQ